MNKYRILMGITAALLLTGCAGNSSNAQQASSDYEADQPIYSVSPTSASGKDSLSPNKVTDYDRSAVTALINQDLSTRYGKDSIYSLSKDDVTFTKKKGIVTATGNYVYKSSSGDSMSLPFTYKYADQNVDYVMLSSDIGKTENAVAATAPAADLSGSTPDKTFTVKVNSSVTVKATHSGDGSMLVVLADENGTAVSTVLSQSGSFETSKTVSVDTAGTYEIQVTCPDGSWHVSYTTN
jgi:hypothetical protein